MYVLDEPSIGLHQRDNEPSAANAKNLRDLGNSVIVVEHDQDAILDRRSMWWIWGRARASMADSVIAEGTPADNSEESRTR